MEGRAILYKEIKECLTERPLSKEPQEVWEQNKPCENLGRVFQGRENS